MQPKSLHILLAVISVFAFLQHTQSFDSRSNSEGNAEWHRNTFYDLISLEKIIAFFINNVFDAESMHIQTKSISWKQKSHKSSYKTFSIP